MERPSVRVRLRGQEFRLRSDEDEESLQRIADTLDAAMARVEQRTGAVDSLSVALLTALNLAREVMALREGGGGDPERLRALIELAESALEAAPTA